MAADALRRKVVAELDARPHLTAHFVAVDAGITPATLMLSEGIDLATVSKMLGHSSISMTLDVYRHVLPNEQRWAVEQYQRVLEGDEG